jgi:sarcosine oxidase subunit gamma
MADTSDWLRRLPAATRLVLHGDRLARTALAPAWGVGFSEAPCRALIAGDRASLWMGPDEYLLCDISPVGMDRVAELEAALGDIPHALVDVSHRQVAIEISGPNAALILNGGCPLDLHPDAFPLHMCTRTVLAKADIVLWRTAVQTFHLEVWRSFEPYVTALLQEYAAEFE